MRPPRGAFEPAARSAATLSPSSARSTAVLYAAIAAFYLFESSLFGRSRRPYSLAARMDGRFDGVDGRFDAVDPRLDAINARLGAHIDRHAV